MTDDQRRVLRAYQAAADELGRLVATLRIRGASAADEKRADKIMQDVKAAAYDYAKGCAP